jgi:hypothetical protein
LGEIGGPICGVDSGKPTGGNFNMMYSVALLGFCPNGRFPTSKKNYGGKNPFTPNFKFVNNLLIL